MMYAAGILLAVAVTAWMVWRGQRRGGVSTLARMLPLLAAIAAVAVFAHLDWLMAGGPVAGALLMVAAAFGVGLTVRAVVAPLRAKRLAGWAGRLDRIVGASFGLLLASLACLALAELGSVIVFRVTVADGPKRQSPSAAGTAAGELELDWVGSLRDVSSAMADFSTTGLLRHVPRLDEYGHEVRALVTLLNSPREDLARVARKRGMLVLVESPAVLNALGDPDYLALLERIRGGDLRALYELAESPLTRELMACPRVRAFASQLKPSDLLADMESPDVASSRPSSGPATP